MGNLATKWDDFQKGPGFKAYSKKKPTQTKAWKPRSRKPTQAAQSRLNEVERQLEPAQLKEKPKTVPKPPKGLKPTVKQEWERKVPNYNEILESATDRVESLMVKKPKRRMFLESSVDKAQRHLLFMNPGKIPIQEAMLALQNGSELPTWTKPFEKELRLENGKLFWRNLRMATPDQKRDAVKKLYFNPSKGSNILAITEALRSRYANISKQDVRNILRSLETYQLNFGRRLPQKITGKLNLKAPGILAIDAFFPSKKLGWWGKRVCLTCMDVWSRYCHVYVCENKKKALLAVAIDRFLKAFAAHGHRPRRMIQDKGGELLGSVDLMERYRTAKDGDRPLVHFSPTGQPVCMVEGLNAQVQRMMQIYRTAGLTDDPAEICEAISDAINHTKRPARGNLTPIELLRLSPEQRRNVNLLWEDRNLLVAGTLKPLMVGDSVRVLLLNRKEQKDAKQKGFAPKWSKEVYTVLKKRAIQKNSGVFRYFIGSHMSYFRHELLKIPRVVDTVISHDAFSKNFSLVAEKPMDSDSGSESPTP